MKSLVKDKDLPENVAENLQQVLVAIEGIEVSSEHLKNVVDTVLTRSMIENNKISIARIPFDLIEVIQSVVTMVRTRASERGLSLNVNIPKESCLLIGDPHRIKQILLNLVNNSLKFTEKGSITISFQQVTTTDNRIQLHFSVKDTGIGMTEEEQAKLFQKFSQANKETQIKYGGSGLGFSSLLISYYLGLMIIKDLLQLMDGTIKVESTKGFGSEFRFTLTLDSCSKQDLLNLQKKEAPELNKKKSSANILVAEDSLVNQRILKTILDSSGYTSTVVSNGLEALKEINSQTFDLVLMDLEMPTMGGIEATKRIRQIEHERSLKPIPIVAVSANVQSPHRKIALETGMSAYVTKPYQKKEILQVIENFTQMDG